MYRKMSLAKFIALFVAAATISQISGRSIARYAALAQSFGDNTFPIPSSLPEDTTLKVDGSTSMQLTNEALEDRFEAQYPNVDVELNASRTDAAFQALIEGDIDLLATGRPLTAEEKAQGIVEVPLEKREKLAIVVGADNPFIGELTFAQFAGIFRGEITNCSELGGPNLPIRFVDRPDYSDTRRALGTYKVFEGKPFETGDTADPVADDETDTVVKALGADGIGYSVVSQVIERDDVRIIPMHQTLPDDPRYPYSQYRAFVYKEGAGPAALAFLGFATTAPGQEVISSEPVTAAPTDAAATGETTTDASTETSADTSADASGESPATASTDTSTGEAVAPAAAGADAGAGATAGAGKGRFPLWLLPLLAIPLLGALLWWLLKGGGKAAPSAGTGAAAGGSTGTGAATVAAVSARATAAALAPRMVLTPRDSRNAYAYWEVPHERLLEAKRQGGETMMVRLYDVTDHSPDTPAAEFPCIETNPDLHLPIPASDRNYCAEVGYVDKDRRWLPLATSSPVSVPAEAPDATAATPGGVKQPQKSAPDAKQKSDNSGRGDGTGALVGGALLGGALVRGAAEATSNTLSVAAPAQSSDPDLDQQDGVDTPAVAPASQHATQTVKIHCRNNAVMFDQGQLNHIEHDVATTHSLIPGIYTLRIRDGVFNYDRDDTHPGEPFVLLWIHGGTVVNKKTGVPVSSTWTTLNGYDDTLVLDVREPVTLCAFFVDTYPDDNSGEITLSVFKH